MQGLNAKRCSAESRFSCSQVGNVLVRISCPVAHKSMSQDHGTARRASCIITTSRTFNTLLPQTPNFPYSRHELRLKQPEYCTCFSAIAETVLWLIDQFCDNNSVFERPYRAPGSVFWYTPSTRYASIVYDEKRSWHIVLSCLVAPALLIAYNTEKSTPR